MQYILLNAGPILLATVASFIVSLIYAYLSRRPACGLQTLLPTAALAFVAEGWLACILAGALILAPHQAGVWVMSLGSVIGCCQSNGNLSLLRRSSPNPS